MVDFGWGSIGTFTVHLKPFLALLSALIVPPRASTIRSQMGKPNLMPTVVVVNKMGIVYIGCFWVIPLHSLDCQIKDYEAIINLKI